MNKIKKFAFLFFSVILIFMFSARAFAANGVVLVLSGGGYKGLAHIGVLKVLKQNNIPIVGIVGTSMGALVGGLAAIGHTPEEIEKIGKIIDLPSELSENRGQMFFETGSAADASRPHTNWLRITKTGDQYGPLGLFPAIKLFERFTSLASRVEVIDFMTLPIPYAAVATDIETGEKVVLTSGSIASAMRASMSIPGVFEPWKVGNKLLVDGGLVSNLPVFTAMSLFPETPIIAVDVTETLDSKEKIQSVADVVARSLTILTHQNVLEERKYANVLIVPDVHKFGVLGQEKIDAIIAEGVKAMEDKMDDVTQLLGAARGIAPKTSSDIPEDALVKDIEITGLLPRAAAVIRNKYLGWIGNPVDTKAIIAASKEIASREDLLTADYHVEYRDGAVTVIFDVVPFPDMDWSISGYSTNIDPYRWVYLSGLVRNVFAERDSIYGILKAGDDWALDVTYRTSPQPLDFWEIKISTQRWALEPVNAPSVRWEREAVGLARVFNVGDLKFSLGYAYEYTDGSPGKNNSSGPTAYISLNTLDVPSDPTKGSALSLSLWMPDFKQVVYRLDYFQPLKIADMWRAYFRLGFAEGNTEQIGHSVYLGAAEELYSVAANPIEAERMAWANIALRRVISRSVAGTLSGELFAGIGYAWDREGNKIDMPWEAGVALSLPNNIIDAKVAVFYTSNDDVRFGVFIGTPIWGHYPLP